MTSQTSTMSSLSVTLPQQNVNNSVCDNEPFPSLFFLDEPVYCFDKDENHMIGRFYFNNGYIGQWAHRIGSADEYLSTIPINWVVNGMKFEDYLQTL